MITFLPFSDYKKCAASLDDRRLARQRHETIVILNALKGNFPRVQYQPPFKMWEDYDINLAYYGFCMCWEWSAVRNFNDNLSPVFLAHIATNPTLRDLAPPWMGDEEVHRSHRSNLVRKKPSHYRDVLGWTDPPYLKYCWPVDQRIST